MRPHSDDDLITFPLQENENKISHSSNPNGITTYYNGYVIVYAVYTFWRLRLRLRLRL